MEGRYNTRSPAVKRLMREAQELSSPTTEYYAQPLEDNLFEWHFTVRGPDDSDFSGGVYHGRIVLPTEYPMKPPNIIVLTPNGRFEVGKKICLSISGHHPESWQPSWSIRTALLAIIGFMPSPGRGTIGSLDYPPEERRRLARRSRAFCCDQCGEAAALLADPAQAQDADSRAQADKDRREARELVKNYSFKGEEEVQQLEQQEAEDRSSIPDKPGLTAEEQRERKERKRLSLLAQKRFRDRIHNQHEEAAPASASSSRPSTESAARSVSAASASSRAAGAQDAGARRPDEVSATAAAASAARGASSQRRDRARREAEDDGWTWTDYAIGVLVLAIALILYRRLNGIGEAEEGGGASGLSGD